jgi:cytochrome P450
VQVILADGTRTHLLGDYHQIRELMTSDRFSRAVASAELGLRSPTLDCSVTEMDRPKHTRIRKLLAGSYGARSVERLRGRVEAIAAGLAGELLKAGPPADLVSQYCAPLTFQAQCELLGVPQPFRGRLRALCVARSEHPVAAPEAVRAAESELYCEVREVLRELSGASGQTLFHRLIEARHEGGLIDDEELHGIATSMFRDGHFLAATQIANSLLYLLEHPRLLALLHQRPALLAPAIEELLRLRPAVNNSMSRVAVQDTELAGFSVPAGATVTASLPAANRDACAFANPDAFDIDRTGNQHLSFGRGIHYCLGAHLARVEIHTALGTLLQRMPGLRLAKPASGHASFVSQGAVGAAELRVTW